MVEAVDQSVGKIVTTLRQLHLERRTLLFFTSDNGGYLDYAGRFHGEISSNGPLRGQKGDTFEGGPCNSTKLPEKSSASLPI